MDCPNCGTPGLTHATARCGSCAECYPVEGLLELERLELLLEVSSAWGVDARLRAPYVRRLDEQKERLQRPQRGKAEPQVASPAPTLPVQPPKPAVAVAPPDATLAPEPAKRPTPPPREPVPFDQWLLSERNIKIALYGYRLEAQQAPHLS